jgi:hypothetical protein
MLFQREIENLKKIVKINLELSLNKELIKTFLKSAVLSLSEEKIFD